jgi:hypothetical protein
MFFAEYAENVDAVHSTQRGEERREMQNIEY